MGEGNFIRPQYTHTELSTLYPFSDSMGAPVMVELEGETDPLKIATKELK